MDQSDAVEGCGEIHEEPDFFEGVVCAGGAAEMLACEAGEDVAYDATAVEYHLVVFEAGDPTDLAGVIEGAERIGHAEFAVEDEGVDGVGVGGLVFDDGFYGVGHPAGENGVEGTRDGIESKEVLGGEVAHEFENYFGGEEE